ncbi:MAG: hypothetical protein JXA20_15400, partial [Spirochaetes bacterium]|nr:hypothetical protein [Spirochaetota bacterium]
MDIEQTYANSSPLNTLDPRTRLLGVLAFSAVVAVLKTTDALLISLVLSLVFVALSQIPFRALVTRMLVFNLFVALLWLLVPWGIPGEKLLAIGPAVVSREGVAYMAALTLRSNAIMLALVAFTASTGITAMTHAMTALRVPDKITYL